MKLKPKVLAYLFWAALVTCFIGSVVSISAFGIELYPLRIISLVVFPLLFLHPVQQQRGVRRFASLLLILMLPYGIASLFWSPDPQLGLRSVGILFTGIVFFFLVTRQARNRAMLMRIMLIWSIAILGIGLLGLYETINGRYLFLMDESKLSSIERVTNSIGWLCPRVFSANWNNLAFINALSALVLLGWALEARGWRRAMALTATILAIILVIFSYSRAATMGLSLGLTIFSILWLTRANMKSFYQIITTLIVLGLGMLFLYNVDRLFEGNTISSAYMAKIETADNESRFYYYNTALVQGTLGSLGFGKGLGASTEIINGGSYHHYLLEILAETGVWFFLGHCILMAMVCLKLWRTIRKGRNVYWSSGLLASVIAFPILCAGPSSIMGEGPYWLWIAFIVAFTEYNCYFDKVDCIQLQARTRQCTF